MKGWAIAISSDLVAILLVAAGVLLILAIAGMLLATRAQRRQERQSETETSETLTEVAIAHWVKDGEHLFNLWQKKIERLDELHGRLAAMAEEIGRLRAQVSRIDELRAENLRLSQECEAVLLERDQLRAILARIGELIQRASAVRPPATGETSPDVEP